ncbi:MAG: saccharopine dehydrogenase family protein, partial [Solirubrobacterales bacterium]
MPLISRQQGPIAVYGATGYTGRLVARELAAAKADFVLSGRSEEKLRALAEELERDVPVRPAQLDDPVSLAGLLADCAAVIDCAGPFVRYGEPVLRAAVETSTHYLDTTGEQPYIRMAFERYGPGAAEAEVAVIPAMGFDFAPGDMIAALTAEGMGEVDEVVIAYAWSGFEPSRGTMLTTLEILGGGEAVEWRKLQWLPAERPFGPARFEFPEPIGRQRMISYPSGEQITVPRHVPTRRVRTLLTASTFAPHPRLAALLQLLARPTGLALRTPLRRALRAAVSRLPEGPDPEQRAAARYTIVCDVIRGEQRRRGA